MLCHRRYHKFTIKQEGNVDPALKLDFYIFLLNTNECLPKLLKNNVRYQGHMKVKVSMIYVGEKVLT